MPDILSTIKPWLLFASAIIIAFGCPAWVPDSVSATGIVMLIAGALRALHVDEMRRRDAWHDRDALTALDRIVYGENRGEGVDETGH